jgi:hypothetical protein
MYILLGQLFVYFLAFCAEQTASAIAPFSNNSIHPALSVQGSISNEQESQSVDEGSVNQAFETIEVVYQVQFDYFSPEQASQFHRFYTQYSGYIKHTLRSQGLSKTEVSYTSTAEKALILNNLQKTAEFLGFEVLIRTDEQRISIQLLSTNARQIPYKQW